MKAIKALNYEEVGAVGDGKHDDLEAIIACHDEANKLGLPVKTKDGATYYIGGSKKSAIIKTDVDFGKSKFIIDDRKLEQITSYVFIIASDFEEYEIKIDSLSKNQTHLDIEHEGKLFVRVFDENQPIFIRKGLNKNDGSPKSDCFILDENGAIYPSIDWDYDTITTAVARSCEDKPITVRGGIFTTVANEEPSFYRYHQRGFLIKRSHVTVCDYEHYVENEGDHGAPYHGFMRSEMSYDVTIKDSIVTPRFIYYTESRGEKGKDVPMGSYDLSFWSSIDVRCENVKQSIDITDPRYWGVYTSNFCKNLYVDRCVFSRFDAHQGVTNAYITNSTLGHQHIQLIGHGECIVENVKLYSGITEFISLRRDYGSIWDGDITVRHCEWHVSPDSPKAYVILGEKNLGDHNYGFECMMANNVTVDGFTLYTGEGKTAENTVFAVLDKCDGAKEGLPYRYITPKTLTMSNIKAMNGAECIPTLVPENFKDLKVTVK